MKQWDIILFPFPVIGSHPAVVITADDFCANPQWPNVNALVCTTLKPGAIPRTNEVRLNGADGLDWATVVRCNHIYNLPKAMFGTPVGSVSVERRRAISRTLIDCFKLRAW